MLNLARTKHDIKLAKDIYNVMYNLFPEVFSIPVTEMLNLSSYKFLRLSPLFTPSASETQRMTRHLRVPFKNTSCDFFKIRVTIP